MHSNSPAPIGREDFLALVDQIADAVVEKLGTVTTPQSLSQPQAWAYLGLSRSAWFRLKSAGLLPKPITLAGAGDRWRKRDLDDWLVKQRPRR
ncbi:MAG: hypothetical protein U0792_00575 [Gemmataceae bacterium]